MIISLVLLASLVLISPYMIRRHSEGHHADKPRKLCLTCYKARRTRENARVDNGSEL